MNLNSVLGLIYTIFCVFSKKRTHNTHAINFQIGNYLTSKYFKSKFLSKIKVKIKIEMENLKLNNKLCSNNFIFYSWEINRIVFRSKLN